MAEEQTQPTEEPPQPVDEPAQPTDEPNQGATGERPFGETPLSVESEADPFAERPEAFVGAAFAGGLALAMILRRFAR
jgi:hypothetical protein